MPIFRRLGTWWRARRRPLSERLAVRFDEAGVRVVVLGGLDAEWNQSFLWADIQRVCFMDQGLYASDCILVSLNGREKPAVVLTEAQGGSEFLGALTTRGYFPEEVWRRAMGETGGGMHCWPPLHDKA